MRAGEIIAIGRPEELGGRDMRPAEIRFIASRRLLAGRRSRAALGAAPRRIEGDRVLISTREPVRAAHTLTGLGARARG